MTRLCRAVLYILILIASPTAIAHDKTKGPILASNTPTNTVRGTATFLDESQITIGITST